MITLEQVSKILSYNPETGEFHWLVSRCNVAAGTRAGGIAVNGYRYICISYKRYLAHRLAWLYVFGKFPPPGLMIDHITGDRDNNRIANLRLATPSQQGGNQGLSRNNTSGVKGVSWHRRANKWVANIKVNRRLIYLGLFEDKEEAVVAYADAAEKHFGEFVRI